jgi:FkbM family methyltransferase
LIFIFLFLLLNLVMNIQIDIKLLPDEILNEITSFFGSEIKTIMDIGSDDGKTSIFYAKTFPNCKVFSIEADFEKIDLINKNIFEQNLVNQISIFNLAIDSTSSNRTFYKFSRKNEYSYNSLLKPLSLLEIYPSLSVYDDVVLETISLKDFFKNENIKQIDLLHLFVHGSELNVLKGAGNHIYNIKMIWVKVFNDSLYSDLPLKREVENYLHNVGFTKIKDSINGFTGKQLWVNYRWFPRKRITHTIWKLYSNVFKKNKSVVLNEDQYSFRSYSQIGEDLIINFIFNSKGISSINYLDIGANHPFYINNTYNFYLKGMRGINIEPNPSLFQLLKKYRSQDINLNIGVSDKKSELTYYHFDVPALNTFSLEEKDRYLNLGHKLIRQEILIVDTIANVINKYCNGIFPNVLFIDVEGLDFDIIKSIDFDSENVPYVICIETLSYSKDNTGVKHIELIDYIKSKGYFLYADTYVNSIFVNLNFWNN